MQGVLRLAKFPQPQGSREVPRKSQGVDHSSDFVRSISAAKAGSLICGSTMRRMQGARLRLGGAACFASRQQLVRDERSRGGSAGSNCAAGESNPRQHRYLRRHRRCHRCCLCCCYSCFCNCFHLCCRGLRGHISQALRAISWTTRPSPASYRCRHPHRKQQLPSNKSSAKRHVRVVLIIRRVLRPTIWT